MRYSVVATLALLAALVGPAMAQSKPTEANMAQLDIGDGKVSFDLRARTLSDVVEFIRTKTKVNIILSNEAASATVTIKVSNLHWLTALNLCAEKAECILERVSPVLIKVSKPERVTFSFENEDITKVVGVIATYSGANIVVSPDVKGKVTVTLKNIPWRDALEQIVKTLEGYAVVEEDRGILRVVPRSTTCRRSSRPGSSACKLHPPAQPVPRAPGVGVREVVDQGVRMRTNLGQGVPDPGRAQAPPWTPRAARSCTIASPTPWSPAAPSPRSTTC